MNFKQLFNSFCLILVLLISDFSLANQGKTYDTLPIFKKNTEKEINKYINSKIDKKKFKKDTRVYFFDLKSDEKGKIIEVNLKIGEENDLSVELKRLILSTPKWTPARKENINVSATFVLPVTFN